MGLDDYPLSLVLAIGSTASGIILLSQWFELVKLLTLFAGAFWISSWIANKSGIWRELNK